VQCLTAGLAIGGFRALNGTGGARAPVRQRERSMRRRARTLNGTHRVTGAPSNMLSSHRDIRAKDAGPTRTVLGSFLVLKGRREAVKPSKQRWVPPC